MCIDFRAISFVVVLNNSFYLSAKNWISFVCDYIVSYFIENNHYFVNWQIFFCIRIKQSTNVRLFQCRGAACPVLIEHPVRRSLSRPSGANWAIDDFSVHGIMILRLPVRGIGQRWRATWAARRVLRESDTMTVSLFLRFAEWQPPWYHSPGKTNALNSGIQGRALTGRRPNVTVGTQLGFRRLPASRYPCWDPGSGCWSDSRRE